MSVYETFFSLKMMTYFLFSLRSNDDSIYIYKEECLSVCLLTMHSVPVIASCTKSPMSLAQAQRKVEKGLAGQWGEVGEGRSVGGVG